MISPMNPAAAIAKNLLLVAALVAGTHTSAQILGCGFDEGHRERMLVDQAYSQRVNDFNALAQQAAPVFERDINTYKVPVVVHVMDIGTGATAITDDQIRAGIKLTNEYWRKVAGSPGAGTGADMNIEFVLAVRDPQGNCTTGITRTDMTWNASYVANGVAHDGALGMPDADLKAYKTGTPTSTTTSGWCRRSTTAVRWRAMPFSRAAMDPPSTAR
ncbi:MAG: hypothetical protein IPG10_02390 [Flavobacteriales bacterium]|nr:hypothetical protein [Flavobacteriales bacterium]